MGSTSVVMKQITFKGKLLKKPSDNFGGSLLKGNPRQQRPLDSKFPIHVVLKGIQGGMRQPQAFNRVNSSVKSIAKKYGITIYEYANVGNHLHMVIKLSKRARWAGFIRELTGKIASLLKAILPKLSNKKYWKHRPFTRIVRSWQKGFRDIKMYVHLNHLESDNIIKRSEIKTLRDYRALFESS